MVEIGQFVAGGIFGFVLAIGVVLIAIVEGLKK